MGTQQVTPSPPRSQLCSTCQDPHLPREVQPRPSPPRQAPASPGRLTQAARAHRRGPSGNQPPLLEAKVTAGCRLVEIAYLQFFYKFNSNLGLTPALQGVTRGSEPAAFTTRTRFRSAPETSSLPTPPPSGPRRKAPALPVPRAFRLYSSALRKQRMPLAVG